MGSRPAGEGSVIPIDAVKASYNEESLELNPKAEHWFTVDWGLKSMSAVNLLQWDGKRVDHLESTQFTGVTLPLIAEWMKEKGDEYAVTRRRDGNDILVPVREVYADASHPFENQQLGEMGFDVTPGQLRTA